MVVIGRVTLRHEKMHEIPSEQRFSGGFRRRLLRRSIAPRQRGAKRR
jgi:hypothetical protein